MARPKISLANHEAVYDYYQSREPHPRLARCVHWLISKVVRPKIALEDGAEDKIREHYSNSGRLILIANHVSMTDPFALAALAERVPALHPLRGTIYIPGKATVFSKMPFRIFRRPILDNFVAVPTFRKKDEASSGLPGPEAKELRKHATRRLIDLLIDKANEGYNIAIFPDGERIEAGSTDARIRTGVGRIACGINEPERFLFQPVGIHYDPNGSSLKPSLFVGEPFPILASAEEATVQVEQAIRRYETLAAQDE